VRKLSRAMKCNGHWIYTVYCPFYCVPMHGNFHGKYRQKQALEAIKLPRSQTQ